MVDGWRTTLAYTLARSDAQGDDPSGSERCVSGSSPSRLANPELHALVSLETLGVEEGQGREPGKATFGLDYLDRNVSRRQAAAARQTTL